MRARRFPPVGEHRLLCQAARGVLVLLQQGCPHVIDAARFPDHVPGELALDPWVP